MPRRIKLQTSFVEPLNQVDTKTLDTLCSNLVWLSNRESEKRTRGITGHYAQGFISSTDQDHPSIGQLYEFFERLPVTFPEKEGKDLEKIKDGYGFILNTQQQHRSASSLNYFKWLMYHNFRIPLD